MLPAWGEPATTIGFEECIALAAQHNADLRNAQANLFAVEQQLRAAYSGYFPQLSGNVTHSDSSNTGAGSAAATHSTAITATQNLFAGFQDEAKVEQAKANLGSAQAALIAAQARVSNDLKVAYAGLLYSQENVALTENIVQRLEENLRLVQLRFESGRENKGSYLLTRASLAQARFDRLQARQSVATAQAQLARALGVPPAPDLSVRGVVPLNEPGAPPDFGALISQTPDYRDATEKEKSAEANVRFARAGFYPSVNLSGTAARQGQSGFADENQHTVTATLSIPLFSGGKDYYGVQSAASSLEAAKANRNSVGRQLLVNLKQNYATYAQSIEKLKVDREFLEAAETRAQIARAQYENGLLSFADWDRIEQDLIQRQKTLLASQRDRVNAEAAWELVQGKGVIS